MGTRRSPQLHPLLARLLPEDPRSYDGPPSSLRLLGAINVAGTARSLVHIVAPDSGAGTIASMDIEVAGGDNIVALLAQWGGAQLLEAGVIWIVLRRYPGLVPLMLGVVTVEQALRVGIGAAKPIVSAHTPPGAISHVLLPVVAAGFALSLRRRTDA